MAGNADLNLPPWLTDAELDDICCGLTQQHARCKYLERLGMLVKRKPNGAPLVARSEFERVMGAARLQPPKSSPRPDPGSEPNVAALQAMLDARKKKR